MDRCLTCGVAGEAMTECRVCRSLIPAGHTAATGWEEHEVPPPADPERSWAKTAIAILFGGMAMQAIVTLVFHRALGPGAELLGLVPLALAVGLVVAVGATERRHPGE